MTTDQHIINIQALTNASAEMMEEAARHDRDTLGGSAVRSDCAAAAALMIQQSQVEALLFVGEQIRELSQTIFDASIEVK